MDVYEEFEGILFEFERKKVGEHKGMAWLKGRKDLLRTKKKHRCGCGCHSNKAGGKKSRGRALYLSQGLYPMFGDDEDRLYKRFGIIENKIRKELAIKMMRELKYCFH